jgi:hypothetical protein
MIFCEALLRATMMNSKSSVVSTVCILVMVALDFFWEEGFRGKTFLFFRGSVSSLGSVTFPCFCSTSLPFISSTSSSPPQSGDTEAVFPEALLKYWISSVLFLLLGLGVSCSLCVVFGMSGLDISARSTGIRRFLDQSLVISSRSSSVSL